MRFGEKIKRMREQRGWDADGLARAAGISRSTVYNVEASRWHWESKPFVIERLATALRTEQNLLLRSTHDDGMVIDEEGGWEDLYAGREAPYQPPPPYEPHPNDEAFKDRRQSASEGAKLERYGLEAMDQVMSWFRKLSDGNRTVVLAALEADFVRTPDAVRRRVARAVRGAKRRQAEPSDQRHREAS